MSGPVPIARGNDPYGAVAAPAQADPYGGLASLITGQPAPPNVWLDMAKSAGSGIVNAAKGALDMVPMSQAQQRAAPEIVAWAGEKMGLFPKGTYDQVHNNLDKGSVDQALDTHGAAYQPKTTAGRYTKAAAEFLPNAAMGGEAEAPNAVRAIASRAAQVIVPAVASQGAADAAKAVGAPPIVQEGARVAGAVVGGSLAGGRPPVQDPGTPPAIPTLDDLAAGKNAAYQAADNAGVVYTPQAYNDLVTGITDEMKAAHISPARHPKAYSVMTDMQAANGTAPSLTDLDQMRQVIGRDVMGSNDPAEQFFGKKMMQNIDEFIQAAGPDQVLAGDPGKGAAAILNARDLNTRVKKIEAINEASDAGALRAGVTGSGGNINNATRQKLASLLASNNWSPDEEAAIRNIAIGSPAANVLRQFGKLSPGGNGLSTALHLALAYPTKGVSTLVGLGGAVAKATADRMTQQRVSDLVDMIAQGGAKGLAAESSLSQASADPSVYDEAMRQISATLGNDRAQQFANTRQALMGLSGLIAAGASPPPQQQSQPTPALAAN